MCVSSCVRLHCSLGGVPRLKVSFLMPALAKSLVRKTLPASPLPHNMSSEQPVISASVVAHTIFNEYSNILAHVKVHQYTDAVV